MSIADTFVMRTAVRSILQSLEDRVAQRVREKRVWDENVRTILPAAQRFYELLAPVVAGFESEADQSHLIEGAWREFRKRAVALSPPKEQLSSRKRGAFDADWTWLAYDNRGKAIRVDRATGQPAEVSQRALESPDLDLRKLDRARTTATARQRHRQRGAEQGAGQLRDICR